MPRLPPSLKWLIDRRGRVDGEIKKIKASLAICQTLSEALVPLEELLRSVDRTLALHEIKIDPDLIPSIRSQSVRINLPRGELGRAILLCLRLNENSIVKSSDIAAFLIARYADLEAKPEVVSKLRKSIKNRLQALCREGVVKRLHNPVSSGDGLWELTRKPHSHGANSDTQIQDGYPERSRAMPSMDRIGKSYSLSP